MSLPQGTEIAGQGGLLTLKAVKRTDAGIYGCRATDFDNLDADLSGEITMVVSCEWQGSYGHVYTHRQTGVINHGEVTAAVAESHHQVETMKHWMNGIENLWSVFVKK